MKTLGLHLVLIAMIALVAGCGKDEGGGDESNAGDNTSSVSTDGSGNNEITNAVVAYCGKCGQEKGSDSCCAEGAETCSCGMHKGSALCCVEIADEFKGKDLCSKCGNEAGSESCCAEGAESCSCGMHKGAALCCKMEKKDKPEE